MTAETYTQADHRADGLLDSILTKPHSEGQTAEAIRVGNAWRARSNGQGWDPEPRNPLRPGQPKDRKRRLVSKA